MNDHNKEQQLRYLEEVCIPLHRAGFETKPLDESQLPVHWNGVPLCRITGKGSVFYRREDVDGKTILIESELMKEGANIGRRNYTVSHESCHHILKMLFPHDYGAQAKARSVHCYYRSSRGNTDWEEWQVETLAAMILLPPECVIRSMERFGLGTQMRLLNRVFTPADYKKFEAMASFMGASKTALSIFFQPMDGSRLFDDRNVRTKLVLRFLSSAILKSANNFDRIILKSCRL